MGNNFQGKTQPENATGNFPNAEQLMELLRFLNFVPFNLVRNGNMEFFSSGVSNPPDNWTLSGTGAAIARESTIKKLDSYSSKITFGSAAAKLYQAAASFDFYKGKEVKAWCYIYAATANIARITIDDGVGQVSSDYHPGDSTWRFFSCKKTISNSATKVELQLNVEAAGFAYFDVANIVDFDSATGNLPNLADAAAAASVAVSRSGAIADRPASPSVGEFYLATDSGLHMLFVYTGDTSVGDRGWVTVGGGG